MKSRNRRSINPHRLRHSSHPSKQPGDRIPYNYETHGIVPCHHSLPWRCMTPRNPAAPGRAFPHPKLGDYNQQCALGPKLCHAIYRPPAHSQPQGDRRRIRRSGRDADSDEARRMETCRFRRCRSPISSAAPNSSARAARERNSRKRDC